MLYSIFSLVKYNLLDIFTFSHVKIFFSNIIFTFSHVKIFFSNIIILYLINISLAFYYC